MTRGEITDRTFFDLDGTIADPAMPDDPDRYWWRARLDVSLSIASYDEWGDPVFQRRITPYVTVLLDMHTVAKHTPKGVWVRDHDAVTERFVLRDARKRWACPTRHEALVSLKARTERRIKILDSQLRAARAGLDYLTEYLKENQTDA